MHRHWWSLTFGHASVVCIEAYKKVDIASMALSIYPDTTGIVFVLAVHVVSLQVLVSCLLALTAVLQISNAQSCPSGCSGCGGTSTTVTCTNAGLTSFPELPLDVQQRVETL